MRQAFIGYYRPTADEFAALWRDALFSFDANVLLNLYRYGQTTRDTLLQTMEAARGRLWLTHQAGLEYHRNRPAVITDQRAAYKAVVEALEAAKGEHKRLVERHRRHSALSVEQVMKPIGDALEHAMAEVERVRATHVDLLHEDPIRDRLTELFEARVGSPLNDAEARQKVAKERLEKKVPPGYKDAKKPTEGPQGGDPLGDVFVWFQLIEHAKQIKQPIIFVTDDRKEDWWIQQSGVTLGPRPELIEEMRREAGVAYYQYTPERFLEEAAKHLTESGETSAAVQQAVEEVKTVAHEDRRATAQRSSRRRRVHHFGDLPFSDAAIAGLQRQIEFDRRLSERLTQEMGGGSIAAALERAIEQYDRRLGLPTRGGFVGSLPAYKDLNLSLLFEGYKAGVATAAASADNAVGAHTGIDSQVVSGETAGGESGASGSQGDADSQGDERVDGSAGRDVAGAPNHGPTKERGPAKTE